MLEIDLLCMWQNSFYMRDQPFMCAHMAGSVGSILSIASVGSVLSVGSLGSAGSIVALLGVLSFGGFLSVGERRAPFGLRKLARALRGT